MTMGILSSNVLNKNVLFEEYATKTFLDIHVSCEYKFLITTTKYYLHSEACVKHWDMQNLSKSRKYIIKHVTFCILPCSFSKLYNYKGY